MSTKTNQKHQRQNSGSKTERANSSNTYQNIKEVPKRKYNVCKELPKKETEQHSSGKRPLGSAKQTL